MNIRITACSDAHIGKSFSSYPAGIRDRLAQARLQSLEKLVREASARNSQLLLIAGDLFDSVTVAPKLVEETLRILGTFSGNAILLIPGNHDHSDTEKSKLWKTVRRYDVSQLHIFEQPGRYALRDATGLPLVLYALPCPQAHGSGSLVGHVKPQPEDKELLRIGLGHGTITGMTPDTFGSFFPKSSAELQKLQAHFWVVGHAHVPRPRQGDPDWLFFPGSSEPDGFDHQHPGSAWFLEASEQGLQAKELLEVGELRFLERRLLCSKSLGNEADALFDELDPSRTLLRLKLEGFADAALRKNLSRLKETLVERFLHAEIDDSEVFDAVEQKDIAAFPEKSFPYLLLSQIEERNDPALLNLAYRLIHEVGDT